MQMWLEFSKPRWGLVVDEIEGSLAVWLAWVGHVVKLPVASLDKYFSCTRLCCDNCCALNIQRLVRPLIVGSEGTDYEAQCSELKGSDGKMLDCPAQTL